MKAIWREMGRAILFGVMLISVAAGVRAADPGIEIPAFSQAPQLTDQGRGFMLIYNLYTSSPAAATATNTRFTITNTNDSQGVSVHLFFVEGASCSISDRYICLSQNQTMTFLASEQDPGTTGYLVAVATYEDGFPRPFDYLVGDAYVKTSVGFFGNLAAEAVPSHNAFFAFPLDDTLFYIGLTNMPRVLVVDNIGSRADGNETLLVINGVGGVFTNTALSIGGLFGILYNDAEQPHSWNSVGGCQIVATLGDNAPRTTPRFDSVIPAGQTGWMKFWSTSTTNNSPFGGSADPRALLGAVFQRNTQAGTASGAFQGARNLHKLNLVSVNPFQNGIGAGVQGESSGFANAMSELPPQIVPLTAFIFPIFPANCGFQIADR